MLYKIIEDEINLMGRDNKICTMSLMKKLYRMMKIDKNVHHQRAHRVQVGCLACKMPCLVSFSEINHSNLSFSRLLSRVVVVKMFTIMKFEGPQKKKEYKRKCH
jgi:hypothetical protein